MLRLQLQETAVVRKSMPGGVRGGARKESPYSIPHPRWVLSIVSRTEGPSGLSWRQFILFFCGRFRFLSGSGSA